MEQIIVDIGDVLFGWFPRPSESQVAIGVVALSLFVIVALRQSPTESPSPLVTRGKEIGNIVVIAALILFISVAIAVLVLGN